MELYPELVRTAELDRYLTNAEACCRGHMRVSCLQIQSSSSPSKLALDPRWAFRRLTWIEWIPRVDQAMLPTLLSKIGMVGPQTSPFSLFLLQYLIFV